MVPLKTNSCSLHARNPGSATVHNQNGWKPWPDWRPMHDWPLITDLAVMVEDIRWVETVEWWVVTLQHEDHKMSVNQWRSSSVLIPSKRRFSHLITRWRR